MKKITGLIALVYFLSGWGIPAFAAESGLVDLLIKNTGVTTPQAEGGAGAIFNTAKQNMTAQNFSKVTKAMPEVESLMVKAPKVEKNSGLLGSASSMLGGDAGSLGKAAGLYDSFSKLGLSKEMVGRFIPLILDYSKSKGGNTVSNLLSAALQ
jgi:Protein of unknown function VcgC/VcgE (DUF2780)